MNRMITAFLAGVFLVPLCLAVSSGERLTGVWLSAPQVRWQELGTITVAQAIPAVTARNYTSVTGIVDANQFTWTLPNYARKVEMSFQTSSDADSTVVVLLGFVEKYQLNTSGNPTIADDAVFLGQLTLTGGTQTGSHSNVYCDTIAAVDGLAIFNVMDSATNRRCVVSFSTKGYKTIVGIATTLQAKSTLYAYGRVSF